MEPLLYLVHRIPYPPNKGDKIRSFHLLKALAKTYQVYLGAFVDDPGDWEYQEELKTYCKSYMLRPLNKNIAGIRSLYAFFGKRPLSIPYYTDRKLYKWVKDTVRKNKINNVLVFSSTMAQYVEKSVFSSCRRVADFVDIDSEKWLQYGEKKTFPMSWIYKREAKLLADYEDKITSIFDYTMFVSKEEMLQYVKRNPRCLERIGYYRNGVDTEYFDPTIRMTSPYPEDVMPIVFTGAMDYWANVDAVNWFSRSIFPEIQKLFASCRFYIVGSNPTEEVTKLNHNPYITVTGGVEDIRPYIKHAKIVVAPMRIARGVQNKVLEAMAMEKSVVVTPAAIEGIESCSNYKPLIAKNEGEFIEQCVASIQVEKYKNSSPEARACILNHYNWESNLVKLLRLFK